MRPIARDERGSQLAPCAGFGYCPAHSRRYWGFKLVLLCAADGTICDFDLVAANAPEREAALALLEANPIEGATIICDKGFAGADFEATIRELRALLLRPNRAPEPDRPNPPIGWIRQRIESIVHSVPATSSPPTPISRSTIQADTPFRVSAGVPAWTNAAGMLTR